MTIVSYRVSWCFIINSRSNLWKKELRWALVAFCRRKNALSSDAWRLLALGSANTRCVLSKHLSLRQWRYLHDLIAYILLPVDSDGLLVSNVILLQVQIFSGHSIGNRE